MATRSATNPSIYDASLTREQRKKKRKNATGKQIPHHIVNENEDDDWDDEEDQCGKWSGGARRKQAFLHSILLLYVVFLLHYLFKHFEHFESNIDRTCLPGRLGLEIFDRTWLSVRLGISNRDFLFDSNSRTWNPCSNRTESSRTESSSRTRSFEEPSLSMTKSEIRCKYDNPRKPYTWC